MEVKVELDSHVNGFVRKQLRPLLPSGKLGDLANRRQNQKAPEQLTTIKSVSFGRCGIRQCRKIECNLSSHRRYAAASHSPKHSRRQSTSSNDFGLTYSPSNYGLLDQTVTRVEKQIADVFQATHSNLERSSTFRQLAHHYFAHQIDRLIQMHSPHLDRLRYKQTMAEYAFSNDVFCVCITANAKIDMIMRTRVYQPDPTSELVYATTAHVLRQQLDSFKQTDIDWLIVLVIALVGFDLAFERKDSLGGHHSALKQLIEMKGGLHTVGHILPYVLNNDRFLAVFTGCFPAFSQSVMMPVASKGDGSIGPYGEVFNADVTPTLLDLEVNHFCLEQCRLIYFMESFQLSLKPHAAPAADASALKYFLYQRDRLHYKGTCLHAYYHENQNLPISTDLEQSETASISSCDDEITLSKSRCVLLAAMIVEYVVTHANYYTIKGPFLATQIQSVLQRQSSNEWAEHVDVLLWILFVLAIAVPDWDNYDWILTHLRHWLRLESQGHWPQTGWQDVQLRNLKRFVWAERSFDAMYEKVCSTLVNELTD